MMKMVLAFMVSVLAVLAFWQCFAFQARAETASEAIAAEIKRTDAPQITIWNTNEQGTRAVLYIYRVATKEVRIETIDDDGAAHRLTIDVETGEVSFQGNAEKLGAALAVAYPPPADYVRAITAPESARKPGIFARLLAALGFK